MYRNIFINSQQAIFFIPLGIFLCIQYVLFLHYGMHLIQYKFLYTFLYQQHTRNIEVTEKYIDNFFTLHENPQRSEDYIRKIIQSRTSDISLADVHLWSDELFESTGIPDQHLNHEEISSALFNRNMDRHCAITAYQNILLEYIGGATMGPCFLMPRLRISRSIGEDSVYFGTSYYSDKLSRLDIQINNRPFSKNSSELKIKTHKDALLDLQFIYYKLYWEYDRGIDTVKQSWNFDLAKTIHP